MITRLEVQLTYSDDRPALTIARFSPDERALADAACNKNNEILLSRRVPARHGARLYVVVGVEDDIAPAEAEPKKPRKSKKSKD